MATTFESFSLTPLRSQKQAVGRAASWSPSFTWTLLMLCGVALAVTGYLAVIALRSEDVAGCGGGALWDCGDALHSRWAKIFSIPVSVPAFALYALLLGSLTVCLSAMPTSRRRLAWGTITIGAIAAGFAALWFVGLQVFVVGHLCIYCILVHLCGIVLCVAILWKRPLGARTTAMLSCVSVVGIGVLIAGQLLAAPPVTFKIERHLVNDVTGQSSTPNASDSNSERQGEVHALEIFEPPDATLSAPTQEK